MQRIAVSLLMALALAIPARAQFTQYSKPGSAVDPPKEAAEAADAAAERARWRLGRLRLHPHFSLTDMGYVENVFSAPDGSSRVNDSHATLGAGLAGYIRLGSKSLLTGYVAPRYFWWQDSKELRTLALSSGLAWFGDFNRLQLSALARDSESQRQLSLEVEAPVSISDELLGFDITFAISRSLAIFAETTDSRARHDQELEPFVPGLSLRGLDRDSSRRTVGIELRGNDLELGLGIERTEVDFPGSNTRDNTGKGPLLRLSYERDRLHIDAEYSELELEFGESIQPNTKQAIGSAVFAFDVRPTTTASLYFTDRLAFATLSANGIIESESRGLAVKQGFGDRFEASAFGEIGNQTFRDPQNSGRLDDLVAFGVSIRFDLSEKLTLTATVGSQRWSSTLPEFDRSSSSAGIGIGVGENLLPW